MTTASPFDGPRPSEPPPLVRDASRLNRLSLATKLIYLGLGVIASAAWVVLYVRLGPGMANLFNAHHAEYIDWIINVPIVLIVIPGLVYYSLSRPT